MRERRQVPLAEWTTLRLGGPARRLVEVDSDDALLAALRGAGQPCLVLGGGSNLVVADDGFSGTVLAVRTRGVAVTPERDGAVTVRVAAGEDWDALVARAVEEGWSGVECLSGIPGLVGAVPIQNVGAYGQEVADTLVGVDGYDQVAGRRRLLAPAECGFDYRTSVFKRSPGRWIVLGVTFRLARSPLGAPVRYAELARALGIGVGGVAPLAAVRAAVLKLRRGKGMVLDAADHDTWSTGSFFTNPVLSPAAAADLPPEAPRWPLPDGRVKTSAAWLVEQAGFARGYGPGPVTVSTKHTLALTNRGDGTTRELLDLARVIAAGVRDRFGVELVNEPVLVGCQL